jgi:hypothetical protein
VIGNPPYVEAKKLKTRAVNLKHYDVYSGTADLSVYFLERGLDLLKKNGLLMFITTNKFFNTEYGKLVPWHFPLHRSAKKTGRSSNAEKKLRKDYIPICTNICVGRGGSLAAYSNSSITTLALV